jgi:ankyrin repeat protein
MSIRISYPVILLFITLTAVLAFAGGEFDPLSFCEWSDYPKGAASCLDPSEGPLTMTESIDGPGLSEESWLTEGPEFRQPPFRRTHSLRSRSVSRSRSRSPEGKPRKRNRSPDVLGRNADDLGGSFLMAAKEGDLEKVQKLKFSPELLKKVDDYGNHALHLAIRHGRLAVVQELAAGPLRMRVNLEDETPLHVAFIHNQKDAVEILLNARDPDGQRCEDNPLTSLLIRSDRNGNTALHMAFLGESSRIAKPLISEARRRQKRAWERDFSLVSRFATQQNIQGLTPLHLAVAAGHESVIRYLYPFYGKNLENYRVSAQCQLPGKGGGKILSDGSSLADYLASKSLPRASREVLVSCRAHVGCVQNGLRSEDLVHFAWAALPFDRKLFKQALFCSRLDEEVLMRACEDSIRHEIKGITSVLKKKLKIENVIDSDYGDE